MFGELHAAANGDAQVVTRQRRVVRRDLGVLQQPVRAEPLPEGRAVGDREQRAQIRPLGVDARGELGESRRAGREQAGVVAGAQGRTLGSAKVAPAGSAGTRECSASKCGRPSPSGPRNTSVAAAAIGTVRRIIATI
ncbi:MAG: hypothetical protein ACK533_08250, partial [Planctomycetota bacterium]